MGREFLLLLLVCGVGLWRTADSAKITCKICKQFVVSFNKQLEATANSSYAGGDTSWEEENLGSYSESEVRLVEILDTTCGKSDYDCHRLLEEAEEDIERWWLKQRREGSELQPWLCFSHLAVCCPADTYGPDCQPCPGAPSNICGGRGKCEGAEEREGQGTCGCDRGYSGDLCQQCDTRFYQEKVEGEEEDEKEGEEEDEKEGEEREEEGEGSGTLVCKECDQSCDKSCDGPDSADCDTCAGGYKENDDGACEDVDECKIDGDTRCREGMYCFNTPGSFRCNECDKACKKICNGPGPVKCAECAGGYTRNEHGVCRDDDECEAQSAKCNVGTYCENTPGKYTCKACHVACMSGCHGAGAKGCVACKDGYVMGVEEGCEDVNECEGDTTPCDEATEVCSNLLGTFTCKCQSGLVKGEEGKCVTAEEREAQREAKKSKKKKKKKKKKVEPEPANKAEVKAEGEGRSLGDSEESGRSPGDSERSPEDSGAERKLGANVVAVGPDDVSVARDVDSNESGSGTGKEPATVGVEAVDGEAGVAGGVGVAESSGEGGPGTEGLELSSHNVQSEGHEEL